MRTARHRTRVVASTLRHRLGSGLALIGACAALILPACSKQTSVAPATESASASELDWARDALKRNPTIEIVATDTNAGVFTIRSKDTGEMRTVKLNEIAAVPVASLTDSARIAAANPERFSPAVSSQSEAPAAAAKPASETAAPEGSTSSTTAAASGTSLPNYTIERADGKVKVSGPGVSIVSTGGATLTASDAPASQRSVEPIICEGRRMLHFDNRDIYVEGDAIVARGGCELYITNSRVAASGTGVVVGDAIVHIANSTVEGSAASFEARDGAQVYVRSSRFQGLPRRAEGSVVQDQGGNQWR